MKTFRCFAYESGQALRSALPSFDLRSLLMVPLALVFLLEAPAAQARRIVVSTTIQAAVDAARPGDTILVPPGIYREQVMVSKDNITIKGRPGAILDGAGLSVLSGIRVRPLSTDPATRITGFHLVGLCVQNYSLTGVVLRQVDHFSISAVTAVHNEEYGIFPINCSDGDVEQNFVFGSEEAGIYVGDSRDVRIRNNYVTDCLAGVQIETSLDVVVENNTAIGNSGGIQVFVFPGKLIPETRNIRVLNNICNRNNRPITMRAPDALPIPVGIGLFSVASDDVLIEGNVATHNDTGGIAIARLPSPFDTLDPRVDPVSDHNLVRNNILLDNGNNPDPLIAPVPGADLLWDFSGTGNCWASNVFRTSFPALPACR